MFMWTTKRLKEALRHVKIHTDCTKCCHNNEYSYTVYLGTMQIKLCISAAEEGIYII